MFAILNPAREGGEERIQHIIRSRRVKNTQQQNSRRESAFKWVDLRGARFCHRP